MQPMWLPICSLIRFASNATMHLFWLAIGEDIWNFKCNQCDYASVHSHNLIRRLKTQSEEKSCKCNQCDYASVHSDGLRRHLKTNSGKKSFKCNQCDFGSVYLDDLRTHLKLTMEKSCTNATMHLFWQSIWEDIWKLNLEKNRSNATNVTRICSFRRFEKTLENSHWKKS